MKSKCQAASPPKNDLDRSAADRASIDSQLPRIRDGARGQAESTSFSDSQLADIAVSIYRARRRRATLFDGALFGEPAWDMLLDLFIRKCRNERVSTTSLCVASDVPQSTGLRWIGKLEGTGLLVRTLASHDSRVLLVEITEAGFRAMKHYVSDGVHRAQMPMPQVALTKSL